MNEDLTECCYCFHLLSRHDDDAKCTVKGCSCEPVPEPVEASANGSAEECPTCFHLVGAHNAKGHCLRCGNACYEPIPGKPDANQFLPCPLCKKRLPETAYDLHIQNCKQAARGYFGMRAFRA